MTRLVLIYGLVSGLVIILGIIGTLVAFGGHTHNSNQFLGYLIMLIGLSTILVGVKQHRDKALGGVIRFWPAFGWNLGYNALMTVSCLMMIVDTLG